MATPLIDTHATIKKLAAAGMAEPQAEVLVETLAELTVERLATKEDLRALAEELKAQWRADFRELEMRFGELEVRLGGQLRAQMLWFFTMLVGLLGLTIAILKFLP